MRGEKSIPRIAYLRGTLELMRPSRDHERITSWIGRLVEVYGEECNVQLAPYRSWTLKHQDQAGAEPDECYIFGANETKDRPLEIAEVWFWIEDRIDVHVLRDDGYERVERSAWLPGLDLALVCSLLDRSFVDAKRELRAALRQRR
jgi:hypothetical protein